MDGHLRILLIDDDPDDRTLISRELIRSDLAVSIYEIGSKEEFDAAIKDWDYDVVITDYDLQWSDGLEVFRTVKEQHPGCPVIMVTGTANEDTAQEAKNIGLNDFIIKSISHYRELPHSIRQALKVAT